MRTKRFIIVEDFIKNLNRVYEGSMTEICIMPLGLENYMNEHAKVPVQMEIYSKKEPDPELTLLIGKLKKLRDYCATELLSFDDVIVINIDKTIRYLEQLRLLKAEYARVFYQEPESSTHLTDGTYSQPKKSLSTAGQFFTDPRNNCEP